jgi:hypothetical protein
VVGSGVDGTDTIGTSGETIVDGGRCNTACIRVVDTFEEGKVTGITGGSLSKTVIELLDSEVSVTDDLTLTIELLRCGKVFHLGVSENTSLNLLDVHLDGESSVWLDGGVTVRGEEEFGGWHVVE